MTTREAVVRARARAIKSDPEDGEMLAVLVDHIGQLERAISLVRTSHESFLRSLPENAVHEVNGPVSMNTKPSETFARARKRR